jgi:hypothetical protein
MASARAKPLSLAALHYIRIASPVLRGLGALARPLRSRLNSPLLHWSIREQVVAGVLAVWNDVDRDNEAEFNEWYIRQHVPERVGVPGFRNGRRHLALSSADPGCPRNFTFYEVDDLAILRSAPYVQRLDNPTPWTQRTMPWFLNMNRTACQIRISSGAGHGAFAGTMQLQLIAGQQDHFEAWLSHELFPFLLDIPGLASAQFWLGDPDTTTVQTTELGLRPGEDTSVSAAIMLSATHAGALAGASAAMPRSGLQSQGANPAGALALFQLVFALHNDA